MSCYFHVLLIEFCFRPRFNYDPDTKEFTLGSATDFDYDVNARVMQRLTTRKSVTDRFKEFLTNLKKIPGPKTDLKFLDVSQSTDSERNECANLMIDMIFSTPTKIEICANVYKVVVQYPVLATSHVSFPSHVTKLCLTKFKDSFNVSKWFEIDWPKVESIGKFFGHLYNQSPEGTSNMKFWFEKVAMFVPLRYQNAIDAFFLLMQMTADTLKKRDEAFFRIQVALLFDNALEQKIIQQCGSWWYDLNEASILDSDSSSDNDSSSANAATTHVNSSSANVAPMDVQSGTEAM